MKRTLLNILLAILVFAVQACAVVKPYQRTFVNDSEMQPGIHGAATMEENVSVYREGASGGGGNKTSGGCGCN